MVAAWQTKKLEHSQRIRGGDLYRQEVLHGVVGETVRCLRQPGMSCCQWLQVLHLQQVWLIKSRWRWPGKLASVLLEQVANHWADLCSRDQQRAWISIIAQTGKHCIGSSAKTAPSSTAVIPLRGN